MQEVQENAFGMSTRLADILEENRHMIAKVQSEDNGVRRYYELELLDGKFQMDMPNILWIFNDWILSAKVSFEDGAFEKQILRYYLQNFQQLDLINIDILVYFFAQQESYIDELRLICILMVAIQIAI